MEDLKELMGTVAAERLDYARNCDAGDDAGDKAFEQGITIDGDILCAPAQMVIVSSGVESQARVTLREGRFHQLKRMFIARNKCVNYLKK